MLVAGIEPASTRPQHDVLPLYYTSLLYFVKPMIVDEPDVLESHVTLRTNLTEPINDMDMDMPLE
ncbi:hypothetical protein INT47_009410, partial [Mucor saturninus]